MTGYTVFDFELYPVKLATSLVRDPDRKSWDHRALTKSSTSPSNLDNQAFTDPGSFSLSPPSPHISIDFMV